MANTTFVDGVTLTDDEWFNHVNDTVYEVLGDSTTPPSSAIGAMKNLFKKGADIASASTTNLAAATGNYIHITGATTINSFGTVNAGVPFWLVFDSALTLTYNATSMILPGAVNLVTVAGDSALFVSEGSGNWRLVSFNLSSQPVILSFTTGDVKLTLKTTADSGWVMCNDGTIGDASSGGTTRANADTVSLFTLLWNNVADAQAAVSSGRGANAAADYAAHKTIALTKMLGRAFGASGAGSGLTSRVLGLATGTETHQLTTAEMPSHLHTLAVGPNIGGASGPNGQATTLTGSVNTGSTGGDGAHANMQPTAFVNAMIKL